MTEADARAWIAERFGDDAMLTLEQFVLAVTAENARQNLISGSTLDHIWVRHIVDSAQLVSLAPLTGVWLDIGTGAGFPGMVAAILRSESTILVEPRRKRAAFLECCAKELSLRHVEVVCQKIENIVTPAAVISARAVGPVEKLLHGAAACATTETRWLLPRGASGEDELRALRRRWGGVFHVKQSITDPASTILVCDGPSK